MRGYVDVGWGGEDVACFVGEREAREDGGV